MTHVITGGCCNDASCVAVCPVDCIHPSPAELGFATAEMLFIDPAACIDCGACVDVCPVGAISADHALSGDGQVFLEVNQEFFAGSRRPERVAEPSTTCASPVRPVPPIQPTPARTRPRRPLRVAVIGSGPAGCYTVEQLLNHRDIDVEVSLFERLPAPFGLVRYGVAPDHQATKSVAQLFQRTTSRDGVRLFLNCEVGADLGVPDLLAHHHAVVVASGASAERRLGVPGEEMPGSHSAREFVAWYNGHPDTTDWDVDLDTERVAVVGNGNVALDVARILVMPFDELHRTDVPAPVRDVLGRSRVREVIVLGRRGPADAAFTAPELHALAQLPWADVRVELDDDLPAAASWKDRLLRELVARPPRTGLPRIALRFDTAPVAVLGRGRVEALRVARTEVRPGPDGRPLVRATAAEEDLACGLVLRSVGYRGTPFPGLPFDAARGTLPHRAGRVLSGPDGAPLPGVYTAGWLKRGPRGVIGTNRVCAAETVGALVADFRAEALRPPAGGPEGLLGLVTDRRSGWIDAAGWSAVDRHEQLTGRAAGRPREKLVARTEFDDIVRRGVVPT